MREPHNPERGKMIVSVQVQVSWAGDSEDFRFGCAHAHAVEHAMPEEEIDGPTLEVIQETAKDVIDCTIGIALEQLEDLKGRTTIVPAPDAPTTHPIRARFTNHPN